MDDAFLSLLRCPLDPAREAPLTRDQQSLVCSRCQARFPIKQGLPVLIPDEAELPDGITHIHNLPCVRAALPRRGRGN
jgi:uncharacterized protein YbaR (Trm112 family)